MAVVGAKTTAEIDSYVYLYSFMCICVRVLNVWMCTCVYKALHMADMGAQAAREINARTKLLLSKLAEASSSSFSSSTPVRTTTSALVVTAGLSHVSGIMSRIWTSRVSYARVTIGRTSNILGVTACECRV